MVRLRLCQFVVASLIVILLVSPLTQRIDGLDNFATTGNDLETYSVGFFTLIGLVLVTVRGLLPRFRVFRKAGNILSRLVRSCRPTITFAIRPHPLNSDFVLLRI